MSDIPHWTVDDSGDARSYDDITLGDFHLWRWLVEIDQVPSIIPDELTYAGWSALVDCVRKAERYDKLVAELDAAYACIRRLEDGWEPLAGQWHNEAECDVDSTAVRSAMTRHEAEAIYRAREQS